MPNVNGMKFPYTPMGMKQAELMKRKMMMTAKIGKNNRLSLNCQVLPLKPIRLYSSTSLKSTALRKLSEKSYS